MRLRERGRGKFSSSLLLAMVSPIGRASYVALNAARARGPRTSSGHSVVCLSKDEQRLDPSDDALGGNGTEVAAVPAPFSVDPENPRLAVRHHPAPERNMIELSPEGVHVAKLRAVEQATVYGEGASLYVNFVTR
jgi:hypothetical protein